MNDRKWHGYSVSLEKLLDLELDPAPKMASSQIVRTTLGR